VLFFPSLPRGKHANEKALAAEMASHHTYGRELIADGFVSPIALASDRLRAMQGEMEIQEFATYTGLSDFELEFLLSNEHMEPTVRQLVTISNKTGKSVMWLLGYHVPDSARTGNGDNEILMAIGKRNSIEDTYKKTPVKGIFNGILRARAAKRVDEANRAVAFVAARIVTRLHLPLENREIKWMRGQPVFIEFNDSPSEDGIWGISIGHAIITEKGQLSLSGNGSDFCVFQTPKI